MDASAFTKLLRVTDSRSDQHRSRALGFFRISDFALRISMLIEHGVTAGSAGASAGYGVVGGPEKS
jgi:hypothetical protein